LKWSFFLPVKHYPTFFFFFFWWYLEYFILAGHHRLKWKKSEVFCVGEGPAIRVFWIWNSQGQSKKTFIVGLPVCKTV
jgi:hypothetical protein